MQSLLSLNAVYSFKIFSIRSFLRGLLKDWNYDLRPVYGIYFVNSGDE